MPSTDFISSGPEKSRCSLVMELIRYLGPGGAFPRLFHYVSLLGRGHVTKVVPCLSHVSYSYCSYFKYHQVGPPFHLNVLRVQAAPNLSVFLAWGD